MKTSADQAPGPDSSFYERMMDSIHRGIVTVDKAINKVIPEEFNPFYYLGGITNLLWVLLIPTGIFLWFYYEPSQDKAFESVVYITQTVPFGSIIRGIHRYAGDAMIIMAILHMLRNLFTDRYRRFRDVPWVSGVVLLLLTGLIGLSGYLLVWDQRSIVITQAVVDSLKSIDLVISGAGTWLARAFLGGDQATAATLPRMFFLHVGIAVLIFVFLWIHYIRLHRPKIWPPVFITLMTIGIVTLLAGVLPVESLPPASVPLLSDTKIPFDIFYLWPVQLMASLQPAFVLVILLILFTVLFILPWITRDRRYVNIATVTPENCTGCELCSIDCPFDAIAMVEGANPNPRYNSLAVVNDDKCAECGICVGACPFHAINLPLAEENQVKDKVVALLK